jgi:hypothetical protein
MGISPKSSENGKQFSESSHKSCLLIFPKVYGNITQFTHKHNASVTVLPNYR